MSNSLTPSRPPRMTRQLLPGLLAALILVVVSAAQAAEPDRVTHANYKQAFKYSGDFLKQFVYDTSVTPNWIGKTDTFWYSFRTSKGTNYYRVNPKQGTKEPLFDREKLCTLLSESMQKPLDPISLPLTRMTINDDGTKLKFVAEEFQYEYELQPEKLTKLGKAPPAPAFGGGRGGRGGQFQRRDTENQNDQQQQQQQQVEQQQQGANAIQPAGPRQPDYHNYAPDRKSFVFATKHNLYFAEADKESEAVQLTKDGAEDYSFGGGNDDKKVRPVVTWSSDSKTFYVTRNDSRAVKELFLVNSLTEPRPTLEKYKYAMPGEEAVRITELFFFDRAGKKVTQVKPKWKDESHSNVHWGKTSDELRFVRRDRLRRHIELCSLNIVTGQCNCLIAEGFENAGIEMQPVRYIDESDEMIWWSERSGWGHYYLCDRNGKCKNAITSGNYRASRIVAVDAKNRLLFFQGNAREPNENMNFQHLYSVHLDGTGLVLLDGGDANHQSVLSPSRQFAVDNCSAVDKAPVSVLRDVSGQKIMDLEKADLSRLQEVGWKLPETFVVKAADGVTDLYGDMWKPFDFDPKKKYPIIANVYPGPQTEGVTHTFTAISANQQLAQLGFIVVQVGHRGGTPTRSKAYASFGYFNLRDYGLADKKSAIEQLAARHSFIDIDRVGIFGHSGGGFMSAAAVLQKPYNDFFKAAVATSGNHDNNIYNDSWAERYHGLKEVPVTADDKTKAATTTTTGTGTGAGTGTGTRRRIPPDDGDDDDDQVKDEKAQGGATQKDDKKDDKKDEKKDDKKDDKKNEPLTRFEIKVPTNEELAANLKGHLLLVHGEMDNNVHPANTMRLVEALIKANKRFDMLMLPGKRHGYAEDQPYVTQRTWDFFVEHLIGDRPASADIYDKQVLDR